MCDWTLFIFLFRPAFEGSSIVLEPLCSAHVLRHVTKHEPVAQEPQLLPLYPANFTKSTTGAPQHDHLSFAKRPLLEKKERKKASYQRTSAENRDGPTDWGFLLLFSWGSHIQAPMSLFSSGHHRHPINSNVTLKYKPTCLTSWLRVLIHLSWFYSLGDLLKTTTNRAALQ